MSATTALVLESDNLVAIDAREESVVAQLERLLDRLAVGSLPLARLDEVVLAHRGLDGRDQARLARAARRALRFVDGGGYYESKNRGFSATTADIVAFGDGDCWPSERWLEELFAPFAREDSACVVAGRTVYEPGWLGGALTAVDFTPMASPLGAGCVRHFLANNVAFRRAVFAAHPFEPRADLHRGSCGVLALRLHREGVPIRYAPGALTVHRTPSLPRELVQRRSSEGPIWRRSRPRSRGRTCRTGSRGSVSSARSRPSSSWVEGSSPRPARSSGKAGA
jgi:hypothetical protein